MKVAFHIFVHLCVLMHVFLCMVASAAQLLGLMLIAKYNAEIYIIRWMCLLSSYIKMSDWKARADVVNLLKDLKKHHTILVVSHDLR